MLIDTCFKYSFSGTYHKSVIDLWRKACHASDIKHEVNTEIQWLTNLRTLDNVDPGHINEVQSLLLGSRPNQVLLTLCGMSMDAIDYSTLACERYITGYCINVTCLKFLEEARKTGVNNTVFLPSTIQMSLSHQAPSKQVIQRKLEHYTKEVATHELQKILIPIHMQQCHWGLMYLDLSNHQLYFDDGLGWRAPRSLTSFAKKC